MWGIYFKNCLSILSDILFLMGVKGNCKFVLYFFIFTMFFKYSDLISSFNKYFWCFRVCLEFFDPFFGSQNILPSSFESIVSDFSSCNILNLKSDTEMAYHSMNLEFPGASYELCYFLIIGSENYSLYLYKHSKNTK